MTAVLDLRHVGIERSGAWLARDIDLVLGADEVLAILGPSGSGKTTLLRLILGLAAPSTGEIRLDGYIASRADDVCIPPEERRIAMIFQDLALWPHMNVSEHLDFVLRAQGAARSERSERIRQALAWVDLTDCALRQPAALSGGERRRVAIARALVMEPRVLLLDEPMANLDVALKKELLELLGRLLRERDHPAIYVTHDAREAFALTETVIVMEDGTIVQRGSWETLAAEPATPFVRAIINDLSAITSEARPSSLCRAGSGTPEERKDRSVSTFHGDP